MKKYIIENLNEFIDASRTLVYNVFGEEKSNQAIMEDYSFDFNINTLVDEEREELDKCLSYKETELIMKDYITEKNIGDKSVYFINESEYFTFLESLNRRLVSNLVQTLVEKGALESAFDEDVNDFIFWVNTDYDENKKKNK
jgi:hypothetical protein